MISLEERFGQINSCQRLLKTCPKSNKLPNLVTLRLSHMIKVTFCFSINYFHLLISIVYSYLEFLEINSSHQLPFWTVFEFNSWPPALSVRLQQLCYIKIIDWDTCTVESKPVTQHDSCAVALLPLQSNWVSVWSDLAIFCTLTTINLLKSPTVLGNFCKGVKIYHFSIDIIFGQLL